MTRSDEKRDLDIAVDLAELALIFGSVKRATLHPDGETRERDTTHTVMLQLLVVEFGSRFHLDLPVAMAFALVHDLPEAYAGDTNTARTLTPWEREAKAAREAAAVERLRALPGRGWVAQWVELYERQEAAEARFVRFLDKVCPKLCHLLNEGATLRALGFDAAEAEAEHSAQLECLLRQYPEFAGTWLVDLFNAASRRAEEALREPLTLDAP